MKYFVITVALLSFQQGYSVTEKSYPPVVVALLAQSFEDNESRTVDAKNLQFANQFLASGHKHPIVQSFCNNCNYSFKVHCEFDDFESVEVFEKNSKTLFQGAAICRRTRREDDFVSEYEVDLYNVHKSTQAYPHFSSIVKDFNIVMGLTSIITVDYLGPRLPKVDPLNSDDFWLTFYETSTSTKCFAFYPETGEVVEG